MLFSARRTIPLLFSLACALPATAMAGFTSLTIFGDSLSDTGNLSIATGGALPGAGYFNGRYSDGPVWVEYLAASLGLATDTTASLLGGNNYSFAGARTGLSNEPPGLLAQSAGLWGPSHPTADAGGLYVLMGGSNDMRDARSAFASNSIADQQGREAAAQAAIDGLGASITLLASRGAKHLMISNIIDLGLTPESTALGNNLISADASARFNAKIPGLAAYGASLGLTVYTLDINALMQDVVNDTLFNGSALYGISNIFASCGSFLGSLGADCASSLFSDALHPTTKAHQILAGRALDLLQVEEASEPAEAALLSLAIAAMMFMRRRNMR